MFVEAHIIISEKSAKPHSSSVQLLHDNAAWTEEAEARSRRGLVWFATCHKITDLVYANLFALLAAFFWPLMLQPEG
ncbi:hypothetical protein CEXT_561251 [Caerostris extrusa]|uniref:Uncharacterized protein n=1 Tax=Caerostris extrusa TaxID=172846 RepID=A0AAV4M823_CAEEX|nr:hypothetical protein CEXT_561251 [Caerostris extrusa]